MEAEVEPPLGYVICAAAIYTPILKIQRLALPTSSMLRIGYNAACLILAVRALGKTGDALGSTSLLSTDNTPVTASASLGSKTDDKTPVSAERRDPNWAESETIREETSHSSSDSKTDSTAADLLRVNVCKYAKLVVETFLEMPLFMRDTAPTCTCCQSPSKLIIPFQANFMSRSTRHRDKLYRNSGN